MAKCWTPASASERAIVERHENRKTNEIAADLSTPNAIDLLNCYVLLAPENRNLILRLTRFLANDSATYDYSVIIDDASL